MTENKPTQGEVVFTKFIFEEGSYSSRKNCQSCPLDCGNSLLLIHLKVIKPDYFLCKLPNEDGTEQKSMIWCGSEKLSGEESPASSSPSTETSS